MLSKSFKIQNLKKLLIKCKLLKHEILQGIPNFLQFTNVKSRALISSTTTNLSATDKDNNKGSLVCKVTMVNLLVRLLNRV